MSAAGGAVGNDGCTPNVAMDPAVAGMQFDTQSRPPRVPQPTSLVINPQSGRIDFKLAGTPLPDDCTQAPPGLSVAECQFDHYLQTLDGFPTVTPAQAPATAALDPATLTVGQNVVVVDARTQKLVTAVTVGFDGPNRQVTVRPARSWTVGGSYLVGVRGYTNGVRALGGGQVVGSPTQFLLKQTEPLTCGAADPEHLDRHCPAVALLMQSVPPGDKDGEMAAAKSVFQLEAIRQAYRPAWTLMAAVGGLPKEETAVLWSFVIHSSSVAELDPTVAALAPRVAAEDEIRVAVQGPVDPTTVRPFIFKIDYGTVKVMDLTAAQAGDPVGSFPPVDARFSDGDIIIKGQAPFVRGHQYGLFFTDDIHDTGGKPLVPSPVSVLLRLEAPLVNAQGHSAISSVGDADAAMLEVGRKQLSTLFDDPSFVAFTSVAREHLVYCFAFAFGGTP